MTQASMDMETRPLPAGWKWVKLGDVANYVNGKSFKREEWDSEGLPIIRIENLNNPQSEFNYYSGDLEDRYRVMNGDILVSWSASLDVYIWNRGQAALNQHIFKVTDICEEISKDFLFFTISEIFLPLILDNDLGVF